jgi:hypothetical protein
VNRKQSHRGKAAIVLVLLFLLPFIHQMGVTIWFYSNYSYLVEEVCEQRDNPDSCCHASCVLKKELPASKDSVPSAEKRVWRCALFLVPPIQEFVLLFPTETQILEHLTGNCSDPFLDQPEIPPSQI